MKVRVLKPFEDKNTGARHYGGATIDLPSTRVWEILSALGEDALLPVEDDGQWPETFGEDTPSGPSIVPTEGDAGNEANTSPAGESAEQPPKENDKAAPLSPMQEDPVANEANSSPTGEPEKPKRGQNKREG